MLLVFVVACGGATTTQAECEGEYGQGRCEYVNEQWLPKRDALPRVTLQPFATSTPITASAPTVTALLSTPTPAVAAVPTTTAEPQDEPSREVLRDGGGSSGHTESFTVEGNWDVRYGFGNGTPRSYRDESCSFNARIETSEGDEAGFPPYSAVGNGSTEEYTGSGTFQIQVQLFCPPIDEDPHFNPSWSVRVYD